MSLGLCCYLPASLCEGTCPCSAFIFGIFCINPELVLYGKVAHPPCANREEAAPFQSGQLGCFTLLFQALSVVFTLYFLFALYHAAQNCSPSPDPPLLITVCPGDFNLFDFYIVTFCFDWGKGE